MCVCAGKGTGMLRERDFFINPPVKLRVQCLGGASHPPDLYIHSLRSVGATWILFSVKSAYYKEFDLSGSLQPNVYVCMVYV